MLLGKGDRLFAQGSSPGYKVMLRTTYKRLASIAIDLLKVAAILILLSVILFNLSSCLKEPEDSTSIHQTQAQNPARNSRDKTSAPNQVGLDCQDISIKFFQTNNKGEPYEQGGNYVIIFDPKSKQLDFKVSLGLANRIYTKDANGKYQKEYIPKQFHQIIADENAKLNGENPIAAINGDYIDTENKPQGLNVSRGVEYSGIFKDKRSSFGISSGRPQTRKATIQVGKRQEKFLNYNLVGGNGRFYKNGEFKDICNDLGKYACNEETSRSMAAITSKGYVILLVNNSPEQALYPDQFDDVLEGISKNYCLGRVKDGMLFDGGFSTGIYFDNKIYVENANPIGSVFLIYKTDS